MWRGAGHDRGLGRPSDHYISLAAPIAIYPKVENLVDVSAFRASKSWDLGNIRRSI